jgi:FAIM1 (Fas apoptotic inhibitory molecule) protein
MKFSFSVGEREKHQVDFSFDRFSGSLVILVDGSPAVKDLRMFSLNLVKKYEFTVGQQEQHKVRIEKHRKLLLAGLRKQKYRVFVDGKLVQNYEG